MYWHSFCSKRRVFAPLVMSLLTMLGLMIAGCSSDSITTQNPATNLTLIVRSNSASVPAGSGASVTASCNPGEKVISGGFSISPTDLPYTLQNNVQSSRPYVALTSSFPKSSSTWSVYVINRSTGDNTGSVLVLAHAVCTPSAVFTQIITSSQQVTNDQAIPLGGTGPWTVAMCPSNTVLLGGGFTVPPFFDPAFPGYPAVSDAYLSDTTSLVPTGWKVTANMAPYAKGVTAYAVCTVAKYAISPQAKALSLYSTVSGYQGIGAAPILTANNEFTFSGNGSVTCGGNTIASSSGFVVPHNQQLADNSYGLSFFDDTTLVGTHIPNYSTGNHGEWDTRFTIYDPQWYTHSTGDFQSGTYNHYQSYSLYIRSICVQVLSANTPTPVPTATETATSVPATDTPTATPVPTSTPSGAPLPPTKTPKPIPTPTSAPAAPLCTPLDSGTQTLNVDNAYLNLVTGVVSQSSGGAHLFWTSGPTGGFVIAPINGAQTAVPSGVAFSSITCSQMTNASFSGAAIPAGSVVFLVKLSGTEYAKVQMRYAVGSADVTLQWQTYTVS